MRASILFYFYLCIIVAPYLSIDAQNNKLSGRIYIDDNSRPLTNATIKVVSTNKEVLSDNDGLFTVETYPKDTIICRYIGCVTKVVEINGQSNIEVILSTDTILLKDVVISGKRKIVENSTNGIVVNIANMHIQSKLFTDILNQMPTLKISDNGLYMLGKSSVLVYINNRQIHLQGIDLINYLNTFSPSVVKKVDIISTPTAQYDAEGNIGIINITLSDKIERGLKGRIVASFEQGHFSSFGNSMRFSYYGRKFSFDAAIIGKKDMEYSRSAYTNYFQRENVATNNTRKEDKKTVLSQFSFIYDINSQNQFSVMLQIPFYNKSKTFDLDNTTRYYHMPDLSIDSVMTSNGNKRNKQYFYSSEVFYKHKFTDKSLLNITLGNINNNVKNCRNWVSYVYGIDWDGIDENFASYGQQQYDIYTGKLDYSKDIGEWQVKGGYKAAYTHSTSNNNFCQLDKVKDIYNIYTFNLFDYKELTNAMYINVANMLGSFSWNVGIRAEYTRTKGFSYNLEEKDKSNYLRLFPVLGVIYTIDGMNSVSINYSSRLKRPQYQMLNPFRWYISKYDYSVGDPSLKPSLINNAEISFLHGNSLYCKFYYSKTNNEIGKMVFLDTENIQNQIEKAGNFLKVSSLGADIEYLLKIGTWYEGTYTCSPTYLMYRSYNAAFSPIYGWGCTLSINNNLYIGNHIMFSLYMKDDVPGYYNYRRTNNSFLLNVGMTFVNKKKNLMLKFLAEDVFKTSNPQYSYYSNGIRQVFNNYYDSRSVNLALVWNFGKSSNKTKEHFESSNIEERQRL